MKKKHTIVESILLLILVFLTLILCYKLGEHIGRDDCLIVIEERIGEIRNKVKDSGSSWEDYYSEMALLKIHRKIAGK